MQQTTRSARLHVLNMTKRGSANSPTPLNKITKLDDMSDSGRFLIIERIKDGNLTTVSPFVLNKAINDLVGGKPREIRKLRDGTVMVRTMNRKQAEKLLKKTVLVEGIDIKVSEHKKLNQSQVVFTRFDLKHATDDEILTELNAQHVIALKRLKRRAGQVLVESYSILLTFDTPTPPEFLTIGYYERIRVRLYVPQPLRCFNCNRFGHTANRCQVEAICRNCTELKTADHKCQRIVCSNCYSIEHAAWDKSCPKFVEEKEIQTIKTKEKIPYGEARKIYLRDRPPLQQSFADTVKLNIAKYNVLPTRYKPKDGTDGAASMEIN